MLRSFIHSTWPSGQKISLLFLFMMVFWQLTYGQMNLQVDSLLNELNKEKNDTAKVNDLNFLGFRLIQISDFSKAKGYATNALLLAEKINFKKGIAYAHMNLGILDMENKNYTAALEKFAITFALYAELQDTLGLARYYHREGNVFFRQKLRMDGIQRYMKAIWLYELLAKTYPEESNIYRLMELMKICDAATFIPDYPLADTYCQLAYEFAKKVDNKKEQADAQLHLGAIKYEQGNYTACVINLKKALELYNDAGPLNEFDKYNVSWINYTLGLTYCRYLTDLPQGLKYYKVSKKMDEESGDHRALCQVMQDMGFDLSTNGYYTEALEEYLSLLTLSEISKDTVSLAVAHKYLGDLFQKNNNIDEAEKYYAAANRLYEKTGNKADTPYLLHKLGIIQMQKGNKENAIQIFNTIRSQGEERQDTHIMVIAYTNLLLLDIPIENYSNILPLFLTDLKNHEQKAYNNLTMDIFRFTGVCYLKMKEYIKAEGYFSKSLELAKKLNDKPGIKVAYLNLKLVKMAQRDFEKAIEYSDLYSLYADSLSSENTRHVIAEIKTKYDTERKEKEIQSLHNENLIKALELKVNQEALHRINLEKAKILAENLLNLKQVDLLANEKRLQQLEIQKNEIELAMQKAETGRSQDQVALLNKDGMIQKLKLKKQTQLKNYFLGGLLLFSLLAFFAYNNYMSRQKLKLQALRIKIAGDLHDDVGGTLSSISIFAEMAKKQSKEVIPLLDTIGESSRKMLDAMADIVWTINPENDQFGKIILRMRSFAYDLLGAKKIDFEFLADENLAYVRLPMEVRKNLYLIFKEATNNMVKYSNADRAVFSVNGDIRSLVMMIRDNGIGFDNSKTSTGNGLNNMKRRAEEIGGKLSIETWPGKGTTIYLNLALTA